MSKLFKISLKRKLVLILLLSAVVPIAFVGYLSYGGARDALYGAEFRQLRELRYEKVARVRQYFLDAMNAARFLAAYDRVETVLLRFPSYAKLKQAADANEGPEDMQLRGAELVRALQDTAGKYLQLVGHHTGIEDVLIIGPDGDVLITVAKQADLGANLNVGNLQRSGLGKAWDLVNRTRAAATVDFSEYPPTGKPAGFVAVPVLAGKERRYCGVLALRLGVQRLNAITAVGGESGKGVEVYLVGPDHLMRSQPPSLKDAYLTRKVDTVGVEAGMRDEEGQTEAPGLTGERVFSSYSHVGLNEEPGLGADFDWVILVEIRRAEAIQPAVKLGNRMAMIALVVGLLAAIAGVLVSRPIAGPISALAVQARRIRDRDLTVEIPNRNRGDEIGVLADSFYSMVESIREQTRKTLEGVNVLAASASEITATVAQLTASTSRTSSAVTETTRTVKEVKEAAKISEEKAKNVAQKSQQAVKISESGSRATEQTIEKMQLIRQQMESIGETVVRLSEHSRAIEAIMATVQDLADQSNLLAVNASIEAARAGDRGKGFSVVAHEIKSLADQSKEATQQVRTILEDTKKWVSAVVMATEQGGKAVEAGVEQSVLAGESIRSLAGTVEEAAEAASVIDASTVLQFSGVEQVAGAIGSIEQAMQQHLSGTAQLEESARTLEELGSGLKELVEEFRI